MLSQLATKKTSRVVDRNPYFSTKIPKKAGLRKFPRKNENND